MVLNKFGKVQNLLKNYVQPVSGLSSSFRVLGGELKLPSYILRGIEASTGKGLAIEYRGWVAQKNYLAKLAFGMGHGWEEERLGIRPLWQRSPADRSGKVDLVVYEVSHHLASVLSRWGCFRIPVFIDGVMDLSLVDLSRSSIRNDKSRVRASGFTSEISHDLELARWCYKELYLPYAKEKYSGEEVVIRPEEMDRKDIKREVLFVKKGEDRVAGVVLYRQGKGVLFRFMGVRTPSQELLQAGVVQGLYLFLYNYVKEQGFAPICFGGTRPFFKDGVLAFKKKWGLRLTGCSDKNMCLFRRHNTLGVKGFLINNPFIALEGKDLVGMFFKGAMDPEDGPGCHDVKRWPGLKRVEVHRFGEMIRTH